MPGLTDIPQAAATWLANQQHLGRDFFLIIDRLAEPDPIPELFALDLMQDYVNLYQVCEWEELESISPWLIRIDHSQVGQLSTFLNAPQRNWGWLASATQLELPDLTTHWQDRLVSEQHGARALYRFQDNRVVGHHLQSLANQQFHCYWVPCTAHSAGIWIAGWSRIIPHRAYNPRPSTGHG